MNFVVANNNNADIYFKTNGSERMRIKSGGNIGIRTINPTSKLHIIGDVNTTGTYKVNDVAFTGSGWTTNGTSIYNNNSGNIGIGLTNPISKLTIKSTYDVVDSG